METETKKFEVPATLSVAYPPGAIFIIAPDDLRPESVPDPARVTAEADTPEGSLDWDSIGSAYIMKSLFGKEI